MTVIKFAPGLKPVLKHAQHDQKTHGNWADGSQGSVSELSDSDIQDILQNTKTVEGMYQKVAERLGKTLKPKIAVIPEGEENLYRGLSNLERDAQQLIDGKIPFTPMQTWGQGIYATPDKQDAGSYGQVIRMKLDRQAKILRGEPEPPFFVDTTSNPYKSDFIDFPRLLPKITSGEIDNFSLSDAYNIYYAGKGYDGYQPHGGEIVLFNGTHLTVNKTDIGTAVTKHGTHDQQTHGNWADSGSPKLTIMGKNDGTNAFFNERTRVVRYQPEGKEPTDYVLFADENFVVTIVKPKDGTTINGYSEGATNKGEIGHLDVTGAGSNPWRSSAKNDNKATIVEVAVGKAHQRRGLATAMLRFHRDMFPELDVQHSDAQLPDGKAWAEVAKHGEHDQKTHGNWVNGSSESGLDAMPYEWKPEFKERERLTARELSSEELNLGRDQLKQVADSPIAIRLYAGELFNIAEQGRFKTLEEQPTLKDNSDYRQARQELEVGLWGVPEKDTGPIYGYIDTPLQPALNNEVGNYGEIKITLKDSVAGRTTITPGDSANHGLTPVLMTDARKGNLSLEQVDSAYRSRHFQKDATSVHIPMNSVRKIESIDYFEAQIHGGISLKDIKSVDVGNQSGYSARVSEHTIKILKQNGIEFIQNG